jgi:UDP-glucose 4-epimerase
MSRILVTGAAGFIGSHVVDRLEAAGHEPRLFDQRPSPYHPDAEMVIGDVCSVDDLRAAMTGCTAVLHLAAAADVGEVAKAPVASEELNARGTLAVLEAAKLAELERVVYASTIWVYSDVVAATVDEDTPLVPPAHLYTASKLAGELYCRSYRELYGVQSTILRFGIPYGPRARPAAVLPIFVRKALAGEALTIAGGGTQSRRFVYVEDLAEGVVRGLAPVAADRTYNLVSDEDVTIRDIAETVREVVGDVELVEVEGRAGDFAGAEVSGARAAAELDWRATTPFAEGVRRYVAWHRSNDAALAAAPVAAPALAAAAAMSSPLVAATAATRVGVASTPSSAVEVSNAPAPTGHRRWLPAWPAPRFALITLVGLIAGALAVTLTRTDVFSDPVALVGTIVLLAIPTALIAGIDWTRDRRDATVVFATMLVGALLALVWNWAGALAKLAVGHLPMTVVLVALTAVTTGGVRRWRAARA